MKNQLAQIQTLVCITLLYVMSAPGAERLHVLSLSSENSNACFTCCAGTSFRIHVSCRCLCSVQNWTRVVLACSTCVPCCADVFSVFALKPECEAIQCGVLTTLRFDAASQCTCTGVKDCRAPHSRPQPGPPGALR